MSLRLKFGVFVGVMHGILIWLSIQLLPEQKAHFVFAELVILISCIASFNLYKGFIKPLHMIYAGIESIKDKDFSVKFMPVGQLEVDALIDVYNQMIDELRQERVKQKEQYFFLDKLIKASPSGIIMLDVNEQISTVNPAAEKLMGILEEDVKGKLLDDLDNNLAFFMTKLKLDEPLTIRLSSVETYKLYRAFFMDRGVQHYFIIIEDLSKEILQVEKKSYEKVIRMMSHEINNSIGAVSSIMESCLNYANQLNEDDKADFENALQVCIRRNQNLSQFMANFAKVIKVPSPQLKQVDLHQTIKSIKPLMETFCRDKQIAIELDFIETSLEIEVDEEQIEQVLVNIIKNAIEAIEAPQQGKIVIKTNHTAPHLVIQDNGKGIDQKQAQDLFTPFYSTKKNGQGIGLTLVREILLNHHFSFSLKTVALQDTRFSITF